MCPALELVVGRLAPETVLPIHLNPFDTAREFVTRMLGEPGQLGGGSLQWRSDDVEVSRHQPQLLTGWWCILSRTVDRDFISVNFAETIPEHDMARLCAVIGWCELNDFAVGHPRQKSIFR
jgi:hypothetical protein